MKARITVRVAAMTSLVSVGLLVGMTQAEQVHIGFETTDNAGYIVGNTIVGVNGWTLSAGTASKSTVRSDLVHGGSQALRIASQSVCSKTLTEDFGSLVQTDVYLAMDATGNTGEAWVYFQDNGSKAVQIGFSGGNLCYNDGTAHTIGAYAEDVFYHVQATVNFSTDKWNLHVTGGSIDQSYTNLAFRDGATPNNINQIVTNSYNATKGFYVDDVSIVPEPASLLMLGCGGLVTAMVLWCRRRRM